MKSIKFSQHAREQMVERGIEVKSSRGVLLDCEFTVNEWETAEALGPDYWLYVIEGVDIDIRSITPNDAMRHVTP